MQKFYLILITVFGILFLFTFFSYENVKEKYEYAQKLNKAYEMFVNGDVRFEDYITKNKLDELNYLLERK
ncbi:hypothetical protein SU69_02725 [Thermosipho melanesiensis]|uniref:Uncharacterized protein n=2 Tax=Thermosipho melanesiensis TaxID=46541 RepID=A6LKE8_THEM4|nr:hypothetical protein [Thermosipho melanesiensis]ABR30399.1 hypothetical protein Tmel_0532 [Thermosipho melanesiensis BI429]APT73561.1 hypothetical protein BW47_02840 [Thermosipho melanesiensis]OOC37512.1 hypothetical protein SU68_02745 [Thermosipho melanesiensis]OOC39551.1 hypothetical protein SU69_02725 [Thermosipho melanesiensis]OOC39568.1 hypothetical protein SU70_02725 [Thermosipho melanesiensis]